MTNKRTLRTTLCALLLVLRCSADGFSDVYNYLTQAQTSMYTTPLAITAQGQANFAALAALSAIATQTLPGDNSHIVTLLQDCAANNNAVTSMIASPIFANSPDSVIAILSNVVSLINTCLNNDGISNDIANTATVGNLIISLVANYNNIIISDYFNANAYDNAWNTITIPLYDLLTRYCSVFSITSLSSQLATLSSFMTGKISDYAPQFADFTTFITDVNAFITGLYLVTIISVISYPEANANNFSRLFTTVDGSNNKFIWGPFFGSNELLKFNSDGSLAQAINLPSSYGTILNGAYDYVGYGNAGYWIHTDQQNILFSPYLFAAGSPSSQNIPYFNTHALSPSTVHYFTGSNNNTIGKSAYVILINRNSSPQIVFFTRSNSAIGNKYFSPLSAPLTLSVIQNIDTIASAKTNTLWLACTQNNTNNALYYVTTTASNQDPDINSINGLVTITQNSQNLKISALISDANRYPVVITYPYTYNDTNYPGMIYQLSTSDGSVRHSYNLATMLNIDNPSIAPVIGVDSINNYWLCINGNALVYVDTTNNVAALYDLTPCISQITVDDAPLSTITPTAITVDGNNTPWLAFAEAEYLISVQSAALSTYLVS